MKRTWIVGTRGSNLALAQTGIVIEALRKAHPGHDFVIKTIKTTGDTVWDKPLEQIGGKGVFVKEIEDELSRGTIDMAVHSTKDVPAELAEGLSISAVLQREDPRDAFISHTYQDIAELKPASRIGTGSLRRRAQILRYRPGLDIQPIRGNVETRLKKMTTENLDGIILAVSGIRRLGLADRITQIIPVDIMVPTAGQGIIALETRQNDDAERLVQAVNDERSFHDMKIERHIQAALGGGCTIPLGIYARTQDDRIDVKLSLGNEHGIIVVHETLSAPLSDKDRVISRAISILLEPSSKQHPHR